MSGASEIDFEVAIELEFELGGTLKIWEPREKTRRSTDRRESGHVWIRIG